MRIDLVHYLKERYQERNLSHPDPGPVITISREAGCPGKKVAQRLTEILNEYLKQKNQKESWKWVGKEVFNEAAKELELEPEEVQKVFKEKRNVVDEFLSSQAQKFYKNDRIVRKTIGDVIRSMANDGHVIVLGRGGVAITKDIPRSLHIYLEGPLEWRASLISEKNCCSLSEAIKFAQETDNRRVQYREYFHGKGTDYTWFDIKFNCMSFEAEDIAQAIFNVAKIRKLI